MFDGNELELQSIIVPNALSDTELKQWAWQVSRVLVTDREVSLEAMHKQDGIKPVKELEFTTSWLKKFSWPNDGGNVPVSWLLDKLRILSDESNPIAEGMVRIK